MHCTVLAFCPSCLQDGGRYFKRTQPLANKLYVIIVVVVAAFVVVSGATVLKEYHNFVFFAVNYKHKQLTYFI